MTSLRQIEANRRNARKSTGLTAKARKERSRRNAVRHGLGLSGAEDQARNPAHRSTTENFNAYQY